jgi:hypothetical protein
MEVRLMASNNFFPGDSSQNLAFSKYAAIKNELTFRGYEGIAYGG